MAQRRPITQLALLALLRRRVAQAGSQRAWARAVGISPQYVSDVLRQHRTPGRKLYRLLGYSRTDTLYLT